MKHRIMITTLRKRDITEGLQYFCFSDGEKNMYCDALTSAEAANTFFQGIRSILSSLSEVIHHMIRATI